MWKGDIYMNSNYVRLVENLYSVFHGDDQRLISSGVWDFRLFNDISVVFGHYYLFLSCYMFRSYDHLQVENVYNGN
jgi:hypothetical protein